MNRWNEIDKDDLELYRKKWKDDAAGHIVRDALADHPMNSVVMDHDYAASLPFVFSIDLDPELKGLTDQGTSQRCWCFAALNCCRFNVRNKLRLADEDFQLSQCFTYFYDQLEKCNQFLDKIIRLADRPMDDRALGAALQRPISDFGYLSFWELAEKYGTVPKSVMPDVYVLPDTRPVTRTLSMKLRWCARKLRELSTQGCGTPELQAEKKNMLADIYGILCRFLGEPPQSFTFEYRDTDGNFHRLENQTPVQFFRDYCGIRKDELVSILYEPSLPFNEVYFRPELPGDKPQEDDRTVINLDIPDIKMAVIAQLKGGEMVTFGSDVAKFSMKDTGLASPELFRLEEIFGTELIMQTPDSFIYKWTEGTHIMCFDGVNIGSDGKPDRWKIQNSYGIDMGIKGHYVASDSWFDSFIDGATVKRKYLSDDILALLGKEPRPM